MFSRLVASLVAVVAALLAAGCATNPTSINAQWVSPTVASAARVQHVLVIAAMRDSTQRRLLEDRMVEALAAAGVKATQSHASLGDAAEVSEDQLRDVVARVGATHVLISSIAGMTTDVRVTPGMVTGPGWGPGWSRSAAMGPGWRGMSSYYNSAWARSTPPEVRTTQNLHGDTRLFDVTASEVVWSTATTTVVSRGSTATQIDGFVRLIVETLQRDSLI
jgi:hypothetical protein